MKAKFVLLTFISFLFATNCHKPDYSNPDSILSFEVVESGMPQGWLIRTQPGYSVSLDSQNVKSGKYAIVMETTGEYRNAAQSVALVFPNNDGGRKITLSGYIKTENIDEGFAGLAMQTGSKIAVDWMDKKGRLGSADWEKYEVTLDVEPSQNQPVIVGGLFGDKGKMWIDDLHVTIDGKDMGKIRPIQPKPFSEKAKDDKEFDRGSNIVFPELTGKKTDDLELLGRIWGLMKYHHPAVAKGNYNWDYELFRILPDYLKTNNDQLRDKILIKWIKKYGRVSNCKTCQSTSDNAVLKPDLSWIENSSVSLKLKDLLHQIYLNRNQESHYYIRMADFVGNPIFTNEKTYMSGDHCPDAGFRLLALYRYWNMIHYFYPNRHLTDKDWNTVLKEFVPYFIEAKSRLEYELAAARLIGEICDSHALLLSGWEKIEALRGNEQIPALVKFIENKLVVKEYVLFKDGKAEDAELKKGDIITHIEGKPVEAIVDSMKKYYPASNDAARLRNITGDILRSNRQHLHISYISSGKTGEKEINTVNRGKLAYYLYGQGQQDTARSYRFTGKDIGYINLKNIKGKDISVIKREFANVKGIIVDIRNYPPSFAAYMLGAFFVSGNTAVAKLTVGNAGNPGEFTLGVEDVLPKQENSYQGKLVVMVNEDTQSQAEFTAMVFRAGANTTIIGSQTAGADGNISQIDLPGGLTSWISGNGIYYPDGRETQRTGIVPDIEVKPGIKGIREGRDELLEKAIEIINQK
jgi:C-terminal processing protease CtpA/Prc